MIIISDYGDLQRDEILNELRRINQGPDEPLTFGGLVFLLVVGAITHFVWNVPWLIAILFGWIIIPFKILCLLF